MNRRKLNKIIKSLFLEKVEKEHRYNCAYYSNKTNSVWKSIGCKSLEPVWESILKEVQKLDKGWVMYRGYTFNSRGDGTAYGIKKFKVSS